MQLVGRRLEHEAEQAAQLLVHRDGIEQARVPLTPAEMGPIDLRLALDGNQVRLDLVADVAATRQALAATR